MSARTEADSMGEMEIPADALYGAQTARAVRNFQVSGEGIGREMIRALGQIKAAAARVNGERGLLDAATAGAIVQAAGEVAEGIHDAHFPVDVFQTGSGTSSNMNANEVIANRAIQITGGELGSKAIHPNDHVNMGQSSNDVFPTAIHLAARVSMERGLFPSLEKILAALKEKAGEFDAIVKTGRTHLQDATPIRLGQEFSGFASQVEHAMDHVRKACGHLNELAIGGTAVGTGLNTHPDFGRCVAGELADVTGLPFREASNHFEAQAAQDAAVQVSGSLKTLAVALMKIANDIRWLGSGPRLGLGELEIPPVQPGSSIMPGKVNPVIAESLIMVCAQVIGNDAAITVGGIYGNFQLNTMLPLIARNLLQQIEYLSKACDMFAGKLLRDLRADRERIESLSERSLSLATALAPVIGYDMAAEIAKEAHRTGRTVREVARDKKVLSGKELDELLDPESQTRTGGLGNDLGGR
jgi:fumarate hydratase class II